MTAACVKDACLLPRCSMDSLYRITHQAVTVYVLTPPITWTPLDADGGCARTLDTNPKGATVTFWLKLIGTQASRDQWKGILRFGDCFKAYTKQSSSHVIRLAYSTSEYEFYNEVVLPDVGTWYHVAAVWRPYPANSVTFINGVLYKLYPPGVHQNTETNWSFKINDDNTYLDFALGELNMYLQAKPPGFIKSMYNSYH